MEQDGGTDEVVQLVENEDYYIARGLMVLTARYHLRRGYCCDQGCRHCPYSKTQKEDHRSEVEDNPIG